MPDVTFRRTQRLHSPDHAHLISTSRPAAARAVALVLHGGRSISTAPVRAAQVAVLRLRPVAWAVARALPDVVVYRLQLAIRGWNGDGTAALRDARWALAQLRAQYPGLPIVLVGHSMGARTCLRLAAEVDGVVALAPWVPVEEPVVQLRGARVRILHGAADRWVPEATSHPYLAHLAAAGFRVDRTVLEGTGHSMLARWRDWNALTAQAVDAYATAARDVPADQPGR